jgi:hypothetical protein
MTNRKGGISVIRVGSIAAVIGVLLVVGGIISFMVDQSSYRVPLEVPPYPNAVPWGGERMRSDTWRYVYYQAPNVTPEEVMDYYNGKMREYYGSGQDADDCNRYPPEGTFPDADQPGVLPYQFICLFQRNGLGAIQTTKVTIQPGVYNEDPALNTQGMTVIEYEQQWQP